MILRPSRLAAVTLIAIPLVAQRQSGELRLRVVDSTHAPLPASGELVGEATQVRRQFTTGADGLQTFPVLPFGIYRLRVAREGFQSSVSLIEIRSELPLTYEVALGVMPILTEVDVSDTATLLNPDRTGWDFGAFSDTAALIMNLDLVISIDSAVAHLAGAHQA